jgi:hypothetical protein
MADYQAFGTGNGGNGMNGPATAVAFTQFLAQGLLFQVTQPGKFLKGYGVWRPADGVQAPTAEFALWQATGLGTGTFQGAATVLSETGVVAGQWNYYLLPALFPLAANTPYKAVALVGKTGFVEVDNIFGAGDPLAAGVSNPPLVIYSHSSGTNPDPFADTQMTFADNPVALDPTVTYPAQSSGTAYWGAIDVIVTDGTPPPAAALGPVTIDHGGLSDPLASPQGPPLGGHYVRAA